ncbi:hypothetical protein BHM03_00000270 [Ensete ventricosum]|nr:hypothetical protein BHM03_00000270 [Ensete ventricosum]
MVDLTQVRPIPPVDASLTARTAGMVEAYDDRVSHMGNRVARAPNPTHALNKSDFLDHKFSAEYHIVGSSAISLVLFRLIRHPSSDLTDRISSRLGNAFTYNNPPPKVKCPSRLRKGESDEFSGPRSVP